MKARFALVACSLASATASFASTAFHNSPIHEESVAFVPSHVGGTVSREDVQQIVLVAQPVVQNTLKGTALGNIFL